MRRFVAVVALATVVVAGSARADDDPKAADDYKALVEWLSKQEKPKDAKEVAAQRAEKEKHCRAFLKDHPDAGATTLTVKSVLADVLLKWKKYDESISLWEEVLKATDEEHHAEARSEIVECLVGKKDLKGARARLDAFLKDHPDEERLVQLDTYLKGIENRRPLKVGDDAPPIKTKGTDDKEIDLAAFKGKVVLLYFWTTKASTDLADLKKLYADLHPKGLELIGIDYLDKDLDAYKTVVEKEQIPWPLVTQKAALAIAQAYGATTLPHLMLVGKDGKILSLGLPKNMELVVQSVKAAMDGKPLPKPKAPQGKPETSGDE